MAGSSDTYSIFTRNWPGPGSGMGPSSIEKTSRVSGPGAGRRASFTWRLASDIAFLRSLWRRDQACPRFWPTLYCTTPVSSSLYGKSQLKYFRSAQTGGIMQNRWGVLALLFAVRTTMAIQFQSVAAMSPVIMHAFGIGLADIGLLIGLYLAPGIVIALPGGEIGRRFGDKQVVLFGLALMIAGGAMIALLPESHWQVAGRLISGTGGVLLN